jgi:hypothetical protein
MPWTHKDQPTPWDDERLPGLGFWIGDLYARRFQQRELHGQKYATLTFPSGLTREVVAESSKRSGKRVHLFGALELALERQPGEMVDSTATELAQDHGYQIRRRDAEQVLVWRPFAGEHFLVTYHNNVLVDILRREGEPDRAAMPRPMELLDAESRALLPPLYATAPVKFFSPTSGWTWYPTEYDGADLFFGLVIGFEAEIGYFSLSELEQVRGPLGLPIERDLSYTPATLADLKRFHDSDDRR